MDLRTTGSLLVFILILMAYTVQTELAQHVQKTYAKPYFLLYLTHSSYIFILPLHLLTLHLLGLSASRSISVLRGVLRDQFSAEGEEGGYGFRSNAARPSEGQVGGGRERVQRRSSMRRLLGGKRGRGGGRVHWKRNLSKTVVVLTFLIAIPALAWYSAVPLTRMTDITAIYNVFAFWAYLLSLHFLNEKPSRAKLGAVLVAILGVGIISYGDTLFSAPSDGGKSVAGGSGGKRWMGNALALLGSMSYAWYEVWYKINVALPSPSSTDSSPAPTPLPLSPSESPTASEDESSEDDNESSRTITPDSASLKSFSASVLARTDVKTPSNATFLLHSNFITSCIGATTILVLWIPIPILHLLGWETFSLPPLGLLPSIMGIMFSGVLFNAGFMILLSLWGPVIASVGNLCTLVLVSLTDTLILQNDVFSVWTAVGGILVIGAFAGLVFHPDAGH